MHRNDIAGLSPQRGAEMLLNGLDFDPSLASSPCTETWYSLPSRVKVAAMAKIIASDFKRLLKLA
jgi:hypothetical protein